VNDRGHLSIFVTLTDWKGFPEKLQAGGVERYVDDKDASASRVSKRKGEKKNPVKRSQKRGALTKAKGKPWGKDKKNEEVKENSSGKKGGGSTSKNHGPPNNQRWVPKQGNC